MCIQQSRFSLVQLNKNKEHYWTTVGARCFKMATACIAQVRAFIMVGTAFHLVSILRYFAMQENNEKQRY